MSVAERARRHNLRGGGVVLKVTYSDMKSITRSRATMRCDDALSIHREAVEMLSSLSRRGVRLIGVGIYNLSKGRSRQTTIEEAVSIFRTDEGRRLEEALAEMSGRYGIDFSANTDGVRRIDALHSLVEDMRIRRVYG